MARSKYNVSSDKTKRTYDGIVFDSELECRFYKEFIKPKYDSGEIINFELQKKYILQEKFKHNGKTVLPITYVADFYIEYANGKVEVIDTKGMPDAKSIIKRKMMWYLYPTLDFKWIKYVKKYGGWITDEQYKDFKKKEKKGEKYV